MDNALDDIAGANITRRLNSLEDSDENLHPLLLKVRVAAHKLEGLQKNMHEVENNMPKQTSTEMTPKERKLWRKYIRRQAYKVRIKARNYVLKR